MDRVSTKHRLYQTIQGGEPADAGRPGLVGAEVRRGERHAARLRLPGGRAAAAGRLGGAAAVLVGLLVVAGCGGSDRPASPAAPTFPTSFASSVPTDPTQDTRAAVLAAYRGMWQAYDQAGRPPAANPDYPGLASHTTGEARQVISEQLRTFQEQGLVFSGELVSSPRVTALAPPRRPESARVEDCMDTSGWRVVRADGRPYEDQPGGHRLIFADLEPTSEGVWQVTGLAIGSVGSC
jgi:hypothetical protein